MLVARLVRRGDPKCSVRANRQANAFIEDCDPCVGWVTAPSDLELSHGVIHSFRHRLDRVSNSRGATRRRDARSASPSARSDLGRQSRSGDPSPGPAPARRRHSPLSSAGSSGRSGAATCRDAVSCSALKPNGSCVEHPRRRSLVRPGVLRGGPAAVMPLPKTRRTAPCSARSRRPRWPAPSRSAA